MIFFLKTPRLSSQSKASMWTPRINCCKCINTYQPVLPHWVCLFWSGSLWQCQDSVSLVHCTAVTYSHSLTHIYSSSIIGLDTLRPQLVPKRMSERQSHVLPLADCIWSCLERCGWLCEPPSSFADTQPYTRQAEDDDHLLGWGGAHCNLFVPLLCFECQGMC